MSEVYEIPDNTKPHEKLLQEVKTQREEIKTSNLQIEFLKARNEKLAKATKSLKNNVQGMLGIEREELKQIFGNTNVSCLELSLEMVTKALEDCEEAARSGDGREMST